VPDCVEHRGKNLVAIAQGGDAISREKTCAEQGTGGLLEVAAVNGADRGERMLQTPHRRACGKHGGDGRGEGYSKKKGGVK
jgi:hypothetical protein